MAMATIILLVVEMGVLVEHLVALMKMVVPGATLAVEVVAHQAVHRHPI